MEKKEYSTPELTLLGDVEELTKGQGLHGSDDQMFFIQWGHTTNSDQTSG